jgi:hypothetical protein
MVGFNSRRFTISRTGLEVHDHLSFEEWSSLIALPNGFHRIPKGQFPKSPGHAVVAVDGPGWFAQNTRSEVIFLRRFAECDFLAKNRLPPENFPKIDTAPRSILIVVSGQV